MNASELPAPWQAVWDDEFQRYARVLHHVTIVAPLFYCCLLLLRFIRLESGLTSSASYYYWNTETNSVEWEFPGSAAAEEPEPEPEPEPVTGFSPPVAEAAVHVAAVAPSGGVAEKRAAVAAAVASAQAVKFSESGNGKDEGDGEGEERKDGERVRSLSARLISMSCLLSALSLFCLFFSLLLSHSPQDWKYIERDEPAELYRTAGTVYTKYDKVDEKNKPKKVKKPKGPTKVRLSSIATVVSHSILLLLFLHTSLTSRHSAALSYICYLFRRCPHYLYLRSPQRR